MIFIFLILLEIINCSWIPYNNITEIEPYYNNINLVILNNESNIYIYSGYDIYNEKINEKCEMIIDIDNINNTYSLKECSISNKIPVNSTYTSFSDKTSSFGFITYHFGGIDDNNNMVNDLYSVVPDDINLIATKIVFKIYFRM